SYYKSNILCPLETLSNLEKRYRIKQIGEKVNNFIDDETTHLYHKDQIQIKSLTLSVDSQDWIVDYSKNNPLEKLKRQAHVRAIDHNYISRNAFRSIAKISSELDQKYTITIFATSNDKIHIDNEEVIYGISESIGKARRQIKHVMITCLILNDINNLQISERHYTIVLYPGIEDYQILQKVLMLLIQDLQDISHNGIVD
ncbi:19659_t:CDS:2, partial [Racocetra fulgida]